VAFAGEVPDDHYGYEVTGPLPSDLLLIFSLEVVFSPCQEKAEGEERDSEEQTSKLPRRVQLAEMLPW